MYVSFLTTLPVNMRPLSTLSFNLLIMFLLDAEYLSSNILVTNFQVLCLKKMDNKIKYSDQA